MNRPTLKLVLLGLITLACTGGTFTCESKSGNNDRPKSQASHASRPSPQVQIR